MKEIPLTQGQVALVDDDDFEELNKFKWQAGKEPKGNYYAIRTSCRAGGIKGSSIKMHRSIMNPKNRMVIDHINHNTLDNRKRNLRVVTLSQNSMNRVVGLNNSTGVKGVHWSTKRNKWIARININKKRVHLGSFSLKQDAINAREIAEQKYYCEFACKKTIRILL